MFYFTDVVYQDLYAFGPLGGLKIADIFCTVMLQFYTNLRNVVFGTVFTILFQLFCFTQQQILWMPFLLEDSVSCKKKYTKYIDVISMHNPSNKSCFLMTVNKTALWIQMVIFLKTARIYSSWKAWVGMTQFFKSYAGYKFTKEI